MATELQLRRGTDSEHTSFTGAVGEVTVNTTNESLHVHDGATAGGFEQMRSDASNCENDVITNDMLSLNPNDGEIKKAINATGSAPIYACRAWVNYDGVSNSIRASENVSSVARTSTGTFVVNFATAMQDANYSAQLATSGVEGQEWFREAHTIFRGPSNSDAAYVGPNTTSFGVRIDRNRKERNDNPRYICVAVFR
jgi:hypothetical protein